MNNVRPAVVGEAEWRGEYLTTTTTVAAAAPTLVKWPNVTCVVAHVNAPNQLNQRPTCAQVNPFRESIS